MVNKPILTKVDLNADLYPMHKAGNGISDFGMDNTSSLLDNGFGLYSTRDLKKNIGPFKTQYFRISLTRAGSATFHIGLDQYTTRRNSILFGIPGQLFSLHDTSEDFLAYYMLFTERFIGDFFLLQNRKQHFPFLTHAGLQCFQLDDDIAAETESLIFKINAEIKARKPDCNQMIRLYIQQIILHANRCYGTHLLAQRTHPDIQQVLYHDFLKLVNEHYLTIRKVSAYADLLHVSPDYLNRVIRACADRTAHELIDEMLILEAKSYLLHSPLSIAEIAYQLEFSDPSHFNRFFKKYSAATPAEFRERSQ